MTAVSFYFGVADRTHYLCRLVRKAMRQQRQVVVTGPPAALADFDRSLWTFDALEFVPHSLYGADSVASADAALQAWLVEDPTQVAQRDVLVNLGPEPPPGFAGYDRLIEVVSNDPDDRAAARQRWRHYAAQGHAIDRHEVAE